MSRPYTPVDESRLQSIHDEHAALSRQQPGTYALHELFSDVNLDIIKYCSTFRPNPHAKASDAAVKKFARQHHIWIEDGGDHYNNMTAFLHPSPDFARLTAIGQSYAVLFYMNDTIGREKLGHMTKEQQKDVQQVVKRLSKLLKDGQLAPEAGSIERAAYASLLDIERLSPPEWFNNFLTLLNAHFEPSFFDRNARAQGSVFSVKEYIDCRLHVSGMYATVGLMEFGDNQYLDWPEIDSWGAGDDLRRLQWLCAAIGALMNDMFSFEKEFIVDGSDFNLIPVVLLNQPGWTLEHAVLGAAAVVREYVKEFVALAKRLEAHCEAHLETSPEQVSAVWTNIRSLTYSVQATWVWELFTERYKQDATIFQENLCPDSQPLSDTHWQMLTQTAEFMALQPKLKRREA